MLCRRMGVAIALCWVFGLCPAWAEQLFVRNQPFVGKVVRDSGTLWVELSALQNALGFSAELEADGARIQERLVRTLRHGGSVLVPLEQVAAAVGAVVREDPQFATIDVYLDVRPQSGLGLEVSTGVGAAASGMPPDVSLTTVETAAFRFSLPEEMQLTRDPRLIKGFVSQHLPTFGPEVRFDALVFFQKDPKFTRGAMALCWAPQALPQQTQNERALLTLELNLLEQFFAQAGSELLQAPRLLEGSGQRFVMAAGVSPRPPHPATAVSMRIDSKRKRLYQAVAANVAVDDEASSTAFHRLMSTLTTK